jgi:glycosyltransferase 2 family protein
MQESGRSEPQPPTSERSGSLRRQLRRGMLLTAVGLVAVYAYMVATAGGRNLAQTLGDLEPHRLVLPLLATFLSYVTMSLSYEGIARAAGAVVRTRDMLRITFVANTANYVLPTGGLSGFALRMLMLNKKGITAGRAVLISFTQTLLTNLMLMVFIIYGLIYMMASRRLQPLSIALVSAVVAVLTLFLGVCLAMVYRQSLRTRLFERLRDLSDRLLVRFGYYERYGRRSHRFFFHIDEGLRFFAAQPRAMLMPLLWIFLDWMFTIGVLYASLYSIGSNVKFGQVVVAFSVGIVFAVLSFVPGGVGVLEVALKQMFESGGVPENESVLAILIFRVSFYVIPVLLSMVLARGAFAEAEEGSSATEDLL